MNWKKGEWGRCSQAGGFTPSTPKTIFNLIAPSYLLVFRQENFEGLRPVKI